jgi:hypothetical protein
MMNENNDNLDKYEIAEDEDLDSDSEEGNYMAEGISLGMCLGLTVGQLLFDNLVIGMTLGMCLGLVIGMNIKK